MSNLIFSKNSLLITFIIPISFNYNEKINVFALEPKNTSTYKESYSSLDVLNNKVPTEEGLIQFFLKDIDEYEPSYLKIHPYCRTLVLNKFHIEGMNLTTVLSVRKDGYGSIILIAKNNTDLTTDELLIKTRNVQNQLKSKYNYISELISEYLYDVHSLRSDNIQVGHSYPFYTIYGDNNNINNLQEFINENILSLYGLISLDITGWKRTNNERAKLVLDKNISRRDEYAFFISNVVALEIDNAQRLQTIKKWSEEQNVSLEFMKVKLIIERILSLETLIIQKFLLLSIDEDVSQIMIQKNPVSSDLLKSKSRISKDLCDYYNISSQNEYHISGVEWIEYGQKKFGIEKIYKSLMSKISILESVIKEKESEKISRGTFIISLFSLILSMSSLQSILKWIFEAPCLNFISKEIQWYITFSIVMITGIIMVSLFFGFNKKKKGGRKR